MKREDREGVYISRRKLKRRQRAEGIARVEDVSTSTEATEAVAAAESPLEVGIVGGGIGGLALALSLQQKKIRSIVFERDANVDARAQGYGLTLQQVSVFRFFSALAHLVSLPRGQAGRATRSLGLTDAVLKCGVASSSHFICDDKGQFTIFWGTTAAAGADTWDPSRNCHVARQVLRKELLKSLNPAFVTIVWGFELQSLEECNSSVSVSGVVATNVADELGRPTAKQVKHDVDVLVGCDGIRSTVRSRVLYAADSLNYLDSFVMLGIVSNGVHPVLHERMIQMSNGSARIFIMPYDEGRSMWQLSWLMNDEEDALALSRCGSAGLKVEALRQCQSFAGPVVPLIEATDTSLITGYPVYDRDTLSVPLPFKDPFSRITLVGDAAHPMSPFKGQGANQALIDAVDLAECLYNAPPRDVKQALRQYEAKMIPRTTPKVLASRESVPALHNPEFNNIRYQLERRQYARVDEFHSLMESLRLEKVGIWSSNADLDAACDRQNAMMRAHKQ
ncbi:hypothetical protein BC830DRAFT_1103993 [Chytriomyces sp. MP71]|nr:hypothetical protein BC830DRAFT_1103993 [Chytriomyces sp. MP71]